MTPTPKPSPGQVAAVAAGYALVVLLIWQGWKNYTNSAGGFLSNIASGLFTSPIEIARTFLKSVEGVKLYRYLDSAGYWTIGYGHKLAAGETFKTITQAQADALLDKDLQAVWSQIRGDLPAGLNHNQVAALISFAFNAGPSALRGSTLLRKLRAGDVAGAAAQFAVWNKAHVGGQLVVVEGLTNRRAAERALFEA